MNRRLIVYSLLGSIALTLLSIFFFDQPIAAFVQRVGGRSSVILQQGTSFLEVISGFPIAKYALTYALLTAGLVLFAWLLVASHPPHRTRKGGAPLCYV